MTNNHCRNSHSADFENLQTLKHACSVVVEHGGGSKQVVPLRCMLLQGMVATLSKSPIPQAEMMKKLASLQTLLAEDRIIHRFILSRCTSRP